LVNKKGARFADELDRPSYAFGNQPDEAGTIVLDGAVARKFRRWRHFVATAPGVACAFLQDCKRVRSHLHHKTGTIAALAAPVGVPAAGLDAEIAAYGSRPRRCPGRRWWRNFATVRRRAERSCPRNPETLMTEPDDHQEG
jgi:hypothetical protein